MSARVPDPHNLCASARNSRAIAVDRECPNCGYNLRGLPEGSICPECGKPSTMSGPIDDPLSTMPRRVIFAFIRGCWLACLCIGGLIAVSITDRFAASWEPSIPGVLIVGISLFWILATLWLTPAFSFPQAVWRGFSPVSQRRRAARWLQWGWVLLAGSILLTAVFPKASADVQMLVAVVWWTGLLSGLAGLVSLLLMLEELAQWTRDDTAERLFNVSMWGLPVLTPLVFVDFPIPTIAQFLITLGWVAAMGIFPFALLSLSKSVTLSFLHSIEHRELLQAREERREAFDDQVISNLKRIDAARRMKPEKPGTDDST